MKFRFLRTLKALIVTVAIISLILCISLKDASKPKNQLKNVIDQKSNELFNDEKIDWHDWKFVEYEKSRSGPGEHGKPVFLTDPQDVLLNEKLFKKEGLYVLVSDKISVNRSIPDNRPEKY